MKYGELTLGQTEANTHILGCVERIKRFLTRQTGSLERTEFEIWKTVKLGLHKSAEEYYSVLVGKHRITVLAADFLKKTPISQEVTEADLVLVDGFQLGFMHAARRKAIYKAAFRLGLEKCPAEVGLALAEQYGDKLDGIGLFPGVHQFAGLYILIGMDLLTDSEDKSGVFSLERNYVKKPLLNGSRGLSGDFWSARNKWVFILPRK